MAVGFADAAALRRRVIDLGWASLPHDQRRFLYRLVFKDAFGTYQGMRTSNDEFGGLQPFDELRCIFVHIPKCAGISLATSLFGRATGTHLNAKTFQAIYSKEEWDSYFKFTIVRNPWDRLFSAYTFMQDGGLTDGDRAWAEANLAGYDDFDTFVRDWVTPDNVQTWQHFRPQTNFVCDARGRTLVDFVGRFENLEHDYGLIAARLGIDADLPHANRSAGRRDRYQDVYNDETIAIVRDAYRADVETFDYRFDG